MAKRKYSKGATKAEKGQYKRVIYIYIYKTVLVHRTELWAQGVAFNVVNSKRFALL